MNEALVREFIERLLQALTAVGILPWWAYLLATLIVVPILFAWGHVAQTWPPGWDTPTQSPPMTVQPDGTIHLDQKPPENWL